VRPNVRTRSRRKDWTADLEIVRLAFWGTWSKVLFCADPSGEPLGCRVCGDGDGPIVGAERRPEPTHCHRPTPNVLTVAVSFAAGAANRPRRFPSLIHHMLALCLIGLVLITAVNLWGIAESARALIVPMVVPRRDLRSHRRRSAVRASGRGRQRRATDPHHRGTRRDRDPEGIRRRLLGADRDRSHRQRGPHLPGNRAANTLNGPS
jgi:hypothetical protein